MMAKLPPRDKTWLVTNSTKLSISLLHEVAATREPAVVKNRNHARHKTEQCQCVHSEKTEVTTSTEE